MAESVPLLFPTQSLVVPLLLGSSAPGAALWTLCWGAVCVALTHGSCIPCPRYSWSGEPLFFVCPTSDVSDIPVCSGCGGERTFECQLMPALVSMLSSDDLGKKPFTESVCL